MNSETKPFKKFKEKTVSSPTNKWNSIDIFSGLFLLSFCIQIGIILQWRSFTNWFETIEHEQDMIYEANEQFLSHEEKLRDTQNFLIGEIARLKQDIQRFRNDWLIIDSPVTSKGVLSETSDINAFQNITPFNSTNNEVLTRSWDSEPYIAVTRYFWGQSGGIILEIGALDGLQFSASRDFLSLGWHRILIEGAPEYWNRAITESSDATYIGSAICNEEREVHYLASKTKKAVGGIAEFMKTDFLKNFHPNVWKAMKKQHQSIQDLDWTTVSQLPTIFTPIPCLQMRTILTRLKVDHINLFILDVEGSELSVLHSIDFSIVSFDVLCVEVDPQNRPEGYTNEVTTFLKENGYKFDVISGRNAWYIRKDYIPHSAPT